ncbi:thiol-disulfide oxidoreductase DCC family protein [Cohnella phaseoli]|uniref:Putative DCC family thiol-disulfide oxidoreductase YuxK n=1 Tax=Cohnella phaseoli TaxID=456490 RepID=A0A3D9KJ07_9BACL|nr:thiol-disulfide oxidoreductase DCC family protein [Cohnella phaseoli]RED86369.1 putative DCC family thiol-disulfide oxidoreductase YuxK [Cohnella phaseoli]
MKRTSNQSKPIVLLIDGHCNMCHGLAKFVVGRDKRAVFRFASLQSELGRRLLKEGGMPEDALETFVMVDNGKYYTKSTAALRIGRKLGWPWSVAYPAIVVPRFVRDRVYRFVARRRYRWFGRSESCLLPTPDMRSRFLE